MTFSDRIPVDSSKAGITFEKALNSLRADGPSLAIFLQSSVTGCSEPKPYKKRQDWDPGFRILASATVLQWYLDRKHIRNKEYCKICFLGIASYRY